MENKPDATKVIHVNFFPSELMILISLNLMLLVILLEVSKKRNYSAITAQAHWDFDYYARLADDIRTRLSKYFGDNRFPILPQRAVRAIRQTLNDEDIVTLDNGVYKLWFARNYRCCKNQIHYY